MPVEKTLTKHLHVRVEPWLLEAFQKVTGPGHTSDHLRMLMSLAVRMAEIQEQTGYQHVMKIVRDGRNRIDNQPKRKAR